MSKTTNSNAHILSSGCGQIGAVTNVTSLKEPYGKALYSKWPVRGVLRERAARASANRAYPAPFPHPEAMNPSWTKAEGLNTARSSPICPSLSRASERKLVSRITTNPKLKSDGTIQTGRD